MELMYNLLYNRFMEIDAIHVFVKVVESGSFSNASRLLKMPKTTVSAKVASLEKRLGVTLIQRTTRKLHVTEAGQKYFKHCALAIKEIEVAESEIFSVQEKPKGLLKITAPSDLGHTLLPKLVCEYLKKYPETEVELIVTNRIVDLVGEGVDLAIRAGELKDSTLIAKKFFEIGARFWATQVYLKKYGVPSHPRDLLKHNMIVHTSFKMSGLEISDDKSIFTVPMKGRIRVDDFETLKSLILLNEGIGFLPEFMTTQETKTKQLENVLPKWKLKNAGAFSFVHPGQKYASPKVRAFIETASTLTKEICT